MGSGPTIDVLTSNGTIRSYASLLDRQSGDPVTIVPFTTR